VAKVADASGLSILEYPFGYVVSKTLIYLIFQPFDSERPVEGYSRNASCALSLISTVVFLSLISVILSNQNTVNCD